MRGRDFYVGYFPVPPGLKRSLRIIVPLVLWAMVVVGFVASRSQPNPGDGVWDSGAPRQVRGIIIAMPYPMLFTADRGDGHAGIVLLVEGGKHGSAQRLSPHHGQHATVSGWPIHRGGRFLLELEPGDSALRDVAVASDREPRATPLGRVTLRGEIVDSKCYLGAMKPGFGKTHKECATLCISGGIPPMLMTMNARGERTYYLLANTAGGPIDPALFPLIADPVEATGDLSTLGGLMILQVAATDVKRL